MSFLTDIFCETYIQSLFGDPHFFTPASELLEQREKKSFFCTICIVIYLATLYGVTRCGKAKIN